MSPASTPCCSSMVCTNCGKQTMAVAASSIVLRGSKAMGQACSQDRPAKQTIACIGKLKSTTHCGPGTQHKPTQPSQRCSPNSADDSRSNAQCKPIAVRTRLSKRENVLFWALTHSHSEPVGCMKIGQVHTAFFKAHQVGTS